MSDHHDHENNEVSKDSQVGGTLSFWAVGSFVVALGSVFYLINETLFLVPVIAFILSIVALIRIATMESLSGKWLAISAMSISAFIFTTVVTYKHFRHQYLISIAAEHAETWLQMVQERELYKTHQLTYEYPIRRERDEDLEVYYGQEKVLKPGSKERAIYMELGEYAICEPEVSIRADGEQCEVINEGFEWYTSKYKDENFVMKFRLKRANPSEIDQVFRLEMRRTNHYPPIGPRWTCSTIDNIDPPLPRRLPKYANPE